MPEPDPRGRTGRRGERIAARYLKRRGFKVLERNVRVGDHEGDLVCLAPDRETVVLVEVRTRATEQDGVRPEDSVRAEKQRHLISIARTLRRANGWERRPFRIDVVAVVLGPRRPEVRHIENAVSL